MEYTRIVVLQLDSIVYLARVELYDACQKHAQTRVLAVEEEVGGGGTSQ
jgi:hypothetical protein